MSVNESMVQDIVKEVMAKMQLASAPDRKSRRIQRHERSYRGCQKGTEGSTQNVYGPERTDHFCYPQKNLEKMRKFWPAWVWTKPEWVTYRTKS